MNQTAKGACSAHRPPVRFEGVLWGLGKPVPFATFSQIMFLLDESQPTPPNLAPPLQNNDWLLRDLEIEIFPDVHRHPLSCGPFNLPKLFRQDYVLVLSCCTSFKHFSPSNLVLPLSHAGLLRRPKEARRRPTFATVSPCCKCRTAPSLLGAPK